jgi:hypothetical protein
MRACQPVRDGYAERGGVKLYYQVHGSGEPTVFLLPTWSIIHSRHWKMQISYLARHCRVVTFDGRGNGRSDRPAAGYSEREFAADALAVMEATGTGRAVIVSLSLGAPECRGRPQPRQHLEACACTFRAFYTDIRRMNETTNETTQPGKPRPNA